MDFNKIINNMQDLQSKIEMYELKIKHFDDVVTSLERDIIKLEKKIEKEQNEINRNILNIKILVMKDIIKKIDLKG